MNRGGAKQAAYKYRARGKKKRYIRNEVRKHCTLTGIKDTVECVSLQETFVLHVKA